MITSDRDTTWSLAAKVVLLIVWIAWLVYELVTGP